MPFFTSHLKNVRLVLGFGFTFMLAFVIFIAFIPFFLPLGSNFPAKLAKEQMKAPHQQNILPELRQKYETGIANSTGQKRREWILQVEMAKIKCFFKVYFLDLLGSCLKRIWRSSRLTATVIKLIQNRRCVLRKIKLLPN